MKPEEDYLNLPPKEKRDPDAEVSRHKVGRPTRLTYAMMDKVVDTILAGGLMDTAAQAIGVSNEKLCDWLKRYPEFRERVETAEAQVLTYAEERMKIENLNKWLAVKKPKVWSNNSILAANGITTLPPMISILFQVASPEDE